MASAAAGWLAAESAPGRRRSAGKAPSRRARTAHRDAGETNLTAVGPGQADQDGRSAGLKVNPLSVRISDVGARS